MKILHVCHNYFPSVGGPQYTMQHVSEALARDYGDDVSVCTTNALYGPEMKLFVKVEPPVEVINQIKVTRLPFFRWQYRLVEIANKAYAKLTGKLLPHSILKYRWGLVSPAIDRMMKSSEAEVIMATTIIYNFSDYPLWRHTTKNPKPFILYGAIHLHKPLTPDSPFIQRAKACDCYIANTEYEKQELLKYGVDGNKIITIGTGIDIAAFEINKEKVDAFKSALGIVEGDMVIGFIGRLVKGKGVGILMEAFRKLLVTNKKIKLLLAGGTTDFVPQIKKARDEEGLPIILVENFDEKMKPYLFHALDIFVLASQSESFGVVFLEAWSCKKPVIGTRMGAIESLLTEGKDSLLFEAGNVDELSKQIDVLLGDFLLRNNLGIAGYQKVAENYTWPVIVHRYRQAYQKGIENFRRLEIMA